MATDLEKKVNGERLQQFAGEIKKKFTQTVNGTGIDDKGNVQLDASKIPYDDTQSVGDVLADLKYVSIGINSITNNVGTVEKGSKVRTVKVSWAFNNAVVKSATLNKIALTADELKAKSKTFSYPAPAEGSTDADPALTADTAFTLVGTDNRNATSTKSTSVLFRNGKYYGVGKPANADAINNDFVAGLTKTLTDNFRGNFTVSAANGNYIFLAFPSSWGTPKFVVGGFEGGFSKVKTFDYTNPSGFTESYDVYQSGNPDLGDTTVSVQ